MKVLVIDDDPNLRASLGDILKAKGFEVISVETGDAALAQAEWQEIDVALIDLRLEDMPGLQVLRGIKERSSDTECILLTGYASQDSAIEAVNLGAYSYYQKPFDMDQLLLSIRHAGERRAAGRALAESQERYQTFINATSDMAFLKDDQLRYIIVNQANALFFGRPVEKIIGKDDFDLMDEEAALVCRQSDQRVLQENGPVITNEEVNSRIYETRKFPVHLQDGRLGVGGYIRDITERVQTEREKALLYGTITFSQNEIYIFDAQTLRFQFINIGALNNLGYTFDQIKQFTPLDLKPEFTPQSFETLIAPLRNREKSYILFETVHRRADGSLYPVEVRLQLFDYGDRQVFLAVIQDITERRQSEKERKESESRYRSLFEDSPIPLWEEDFSAVKQKLEKLRKRGVKDFRTYFKSHPDFVSECVKLVQIVDVNNAAIELNGAASKQDLLKSLTIVLPDDSYDVFQEELALMAEGKTKFNWEGINQTLDGRRLEVSASWTVAPGHEDSLSKVIISIVDITERKKAQDELQKRLNELEVLYESGLTFSRILEPKEIGREMIELLSQKLAWHHAAIRLYQPETGAVEVLAMSHPGLDAERLETARQRLQKIAGGLNKGLSGWVIKHGRAVRSGNIIEDERYLATYPEIHSGVYVPIQAGGRTIGSIAVESEAVNAFSERDERILFTLASQAAVAFDNARLYQEALRAADRRAVLHRASQEITAAGLDLEAVYTSIHRAVAELMPFDVILIGQNDRERGEIDAIYTVDSGERYPGLRIPVGQGITGQVVQKQASLCIRDYHKEKHGISTPYVKMEARSILAVPMFAGFYVTGVISVQSYQPGVYNQEDQALLEMLAAYAASAIENARLFEQVQRRLRESQSLGAASQALTRSLEIQPLLENILDSARQAIPAAEKGTITLKETDDLLRIRAMSGYQDKRLLHLSFSLGEGYVSRVFEEQHPINIDDVQADYRINYDGQFVEMTTVQSAISAPLTARGEKIGVISLDNDSRKSAFTEDDLHLLVSFASSAAVAIQNTRLFEQTAHRAEQMFTVNEIGHMLSETLDLTQIYARLTGAIHQLLPDVCALFISLYDEHTQTITCASADVDGAFVDVKELPQLFFDPEGKNCQSRVLLSGEALIVNDLTATLGKGPRIKLIGDSTQTPESDLYLPMFSKGKPIGLIQVQSYTRNRFVQEDVNLLSLVANTAAITIENARLYQTAQQELAERQRAEAELRTLNLELEQRVQTRTAELQTLNAELARASRLKDEFLASMSHELRTPLTGIINISEALQEQVYGVMNEKQIKSLHMIEESGQHLLGLINDILDLSKIEAGQLELQLETFPVNDICQSSVQMIKGMAQRKNQSVSFTIQPVSIELCADPRRLRQILVNLLSNAVKFTPEGGKIGLEVNCNSEMHNVCFTVWDTGIGIAAEDLPKLFRPFTQLDSSLSRQHSGTGLGLALVQRMVDLHGGSVSLKSTPGQGSRFSVLLPWQIDDNPVKEANSVEVPGSFMQRTRDTSRPLILLVDDNETILTVYSDYLLAHGYRLELAYSGQEGVRLAQESKPDLIIMDIHMPGMDGLEAIRQIRGSEHTELHSTIILALTALAMPGDRQRCLEAGANEYLSKPVSLKQLESVIQEQLSQPGRKLENEI